LGRGCARIGTTLAALVLSGCQEPVPRTPTFAVDVKPIFQAHCVRCHGAGGTLNKDPRALEPAEPTNGFLDQYADNVDCSPDAAGNIPSSCQRGARYEAENGNIRFYIHAKSGLRMPMPPSDPLAPWELEVVDNWLAETPPAP
jgi:hypothetical protein